jgi:hypothetical protein
MADLSSLKNRYLDYQAYTKELFSKAKFTDGFFGFGDDPRKDKGHTQFFDEVGQIVEALSQESLSPEEAAEAVQFILNAPSLAEDNKTMEWMLIAAQQHAIPLVPFLSPTDARAILAAYEKENPRRMRLPSQNQVVKALKAQSKGSK